MCLSKFSLVFDLLVNLKDFGSSLICIIRDNKFSIAIIFRLNTQICKKKNDKLIENIPKN